MSILVGSIALGLAADDTIHFFCNFQRYLLKAGNPEEAVRQTLNTTGMALLFTSVVLSIGFFSYTCFPNHATLLRRHWQEGLSC